MNVLSLTNSLVLAFGDPPLNGMTWSQLTAEMLESSNSKKLSRADLIFVLYVADAAARRHSTLEFLVTPPSEADECEKWKNARAEYDSIWGDKFGAVVHRWSDIYVPGYTLEELRHGLTVRDCNYYRSTSRCIKDVRDKLVIPGFKKTFYGEDLGVFIGAMLGLLDRSQGKIYSRTADRNELIVFYSVRQAWKFYSDRCFCERRLKPD